MSTVALLGTGLLGRGFAERLLEEGHAVRVWNRTASKAAPLAEYGATVARTPAEAVEGAERVHLVLSEDAAVDHVIDDLRPGLGAGVPLVDHSTNAPAGVEARFARLRGADPAVRYLHAPVFMAPANARAATGMMLVSGPAEEIEALRPALEAMTGRLVQLSERPSHAAAIKLVGNGALLMMTATMGDLFRVAAPHGVTPEEVVGLFESFSPSPKAMGKRVLRSLEGEASFETTMARKDCRLMIEAAGADAPLMLLPAVAQALDRAIGAGQGDRDFAIFAHPAATPDQE